MSKYVTFSFDDGTEQDKDLCAMLREYGYKCTFNLNSGIQSASYCWEKEGKKVRRLNVDEAIEAYRGHEIAAHTLTHPRLETLDDETVRNEVFYDKKNLENWFGTEVVGLAYPCGSYDRRVMSLVRGCGIGYARTTGNSLCFDVPKSLMDYRPTCHYASPEIFDLIEKFALLPDGEERKVFFIWGHSFELYLRDEWGLLRRIFDALKGCGAQFVTNREAFGL